MIRVPVRLGLLALPVLAACDLSSPTWEAEFFFPVDYPDVQLADYAVAGQIPDLDITFSSEVEQQDITGLLEELLSDDLTGLTLEIITVSSVEVTASMTLTIAPTDSVFTGGPPSSSEAIVVQLTAGQNVDTTVVQADAALLRDAVALYYQTEGSMRGRTGGTPVGASDRITVDVNLLARYRIKP